MARKDKKGLGEVKSSSAQKQFTDREEPQKSFVKALSRVNTREYNILTFYGVGGIGKSSLQKHLKEKHLDIDENSVYSWLNFEMEDNRSAQKAYRVIVDNFKSKFKIPFISFDIAYTIYLGKSNPSLELKKDSLPFLEEGSLLAEAVGLVESTGGIAGFALSIIDYAAKKLQEVSFNQDVQSELKRLQDMEVEEIEKELAVFLAYDIATYKKKNPQKKVVIFLDTYEALWQNDRSESNRLSKDEWIRDSLVTELSNVLFVICGREKIRWEEDDTSWTQSDENGELDLEQHTIGNLSPEDAEFFLKSCGINDSIIQAEIIESSEGVPYYLDLSVDTYYKIKNRGIIPTPEDFSEVDKHKIFERFMRYLDKEEISTLKVLANARFYTKELFSTLVQEFQTGYPVTELNQLNTFSFISRDTKEFFIHDLMRLSLLSFQDEELIYDVNSYIFEYYEKQIQDLKMNTISDKSTFYLLEAFYHKSNLRDIEALFKWFDKYFSIFMYGAKYDSLLVPTKQLMYLAEEDANTSSLTLSTIYNNLAYLYIMTKRYRESDELFQKSLKIRESAKEENLVAEVYNNLAYLSRKRDDYDYKLSLEYCEKSLLIREKALGSKHEQTANSYNNIAVLYKLNTQYEKSLEYFKKAIDVRESVMEFDHAYTLTSYNDIGELYVVLKEYENAESFFKKSLKGREEILAEIHEDRFVIYNNLASLYELKNELMKALGFYKKALYIKRNLLGNGHQESLNYEKNVDRLLKA